MSAAREFELLRLRQLADSIKVLASSGVLAVADLREVSEQLRAIDTDLFEVVGEKALKASKKADKRPRSFHS